MVIISARPRERRPVEEAVCKKESASPMTDSFVLKVQEAYHGLGTDEAPVITTMAVSGDVPLGGSTFGSVQEGSGPSYQLPVRTAPRTRPHKDNPSLPQLSLSHYGLGPSACAFVFAEHHHFTSLTTSLGKSYKAENRTQSQSFCVEGHQLRQGSATRGSFFHLMRLTACKLINKCLITMHFILLHSFFICSQFEIERLCV